MWRHVRFYLNIKKRGLKFVPNSPLRLVSQNRQNEPQSDWLDELIHNLIGQTFLSDRATLGH